MDMTAWMRVTELVLSRSEDVHLFDVSLLSALYYMNRSLSKEVVTVIIAH